MTGKHTTTKGGSKSKAEGRQESGGTGAVGDGACIQNDASQGGGWHEYLRSLSRNIYAAGAPYPSPGQLKARMVELCDAAVHDESEEGDILFNIFDELYTLIEHAADEGPVLLEVARDAAFMRSSRFRDALYRERRQGPQGEEEKKD